jgi:hypothetical protein
MLKKMNDLDFPRLAFVAVGEGSYDERARVYSLDWGPVDAARLAARREWLRQCRPSLPELPGGPDRERLFPLAHDADLAAMRFSLTRDYLEEVRHECALAVAEWHRRRGFDTMVRERLLEGAQAHVESAFFLLADCLVEPGTAKWDRVGRHLALAMMLYKFWDGQVGYGLPWHLAGLDGLALGAGKDPDTWERTSKFLEAARHQRREYEEIIARYTPSREADKKATEEPAGEASRG